MNNTPTPWIAPWPENGLEHVGHCPVCADTERTLLHAELVDNSFLVAPGKWTLWQCGGCRSAYLDPRPSPDSIHVAYEAYYTHEANRSQPDYATLSPMLRLRKRLVNGYTNWRYGTQAAPASALGALAGLAIHPFYPAVDHYYRHLPRLAGTAGKVLDVGCGDGSFLRLARTCGWDVVGVDPDPKAVANAATQGLTVRQGGLEQFTGESSLFDLITLSHVIEHVHDPRMVLKRCHELLKPGGHIWLETPNIEGFGHARFRRNWRGLETPRHLALFNRRSLESALVHAGFHDVRDLPRHSPISSMFGMSFAMQLGRRPTETVTWPWPLKLQSALAAFAQLLFPRRREFLTMTARKT